MIVSPALDFAIDGDDDARLIVNEWASEYAHPFDVDADVHVDASSYNGATTITLHASSSRAMHTVLLTYCGGDADEARRLLRECVSR